MTEGMSRAAPLCLVLVTLGASCAEDVVIGRYLAQVALDGGDDGGSGAVDGGAVDAGSADAGVVDAGVDDAGAVDAGADDAGVVDGGMVDAGADDAGAVDAGDLDGGLDAGADAGPDLVLSLVGDWVLEVDAGAQAWQLTVFNAGQVGVGPQTIELGVAPAVVVTSASCLDAGPGPDGGSRLRCTVGSLAPMAGSPLDLSLEVVGGTLRFYELTAEVAAAPGELVVANNRLRQPIGLTQGGLGAVVVSPPRDIALEACFGSVLTSFSQCVPSSLIVGTGRLVSDGGFLDDAGTPGTWRMGASGRNIVLMPPLGAAAPFSGYVGASVSATCFEGVVQSSAGRAYIGAWRGCLQ